MTIQFSCSCGQPLTVRAEYAGKRVQCPRCTRIHVAPSPPPVLEVPPQPTAVTGARPAPRRPGPAAREDVEGVADRVPAPRKRRRRVSPRVWGAAVAAVTVGGVALALWLLLRGGAAGDFNFVPRDAQVVVTVRVADALETPLGKQGSDFLDQLSGQGRRGPLGEVESRYGVGLRDLDRLTFVLLDAKQGLAWEIVKAKEAVDRDKVLGGLRGADEREHKGKKYHAGGGGAVYFIGDKEFVRADREEALRACLERGSSGSGPLKDVLKLASKKENHLVAGFAIPEELLELARKQLPPGVEFEDVRDIRSGHLTVSLGEEAAGEVAVHFKDQDAAAKAERTLRDLLGTARIALRVGRQQIKEAAPVEKFDDLYNAVVRTVNDLEPRRNDTAVTLAWKIDRPTVQLAEEALRLAAGGVRQAAGNLQMGNNLKQLGLAVHNYHDTYRGLPRAVTGDAQGRPLYSWRVDLLPYVEEDGLFRQFDRTKTWDDPVNLPLLKRMPKVYQSPDDPENNAAGKTHVQVFTGTNIFQEQALPQVRHLARIPGSFPDGTSNTIIFAEARVAVPWTAPQDMRLPPQGPIKRLLLDRGGRGLLVGLGDGSARTVPSTITEETLRRAIIPNDGLVLGEDWVGDPRPRRPPGPPPELRKDRK